MSKQQSQKCIEGRSVHGPSITLVRTGLLFGSPTATWRCDSCNAETTAVIAIPGAEAFWNKPSPSEEDPK